MDGSSRRKATRIWEDAVPIRPATSKDVAPLPDIPMGLFYGGAWHDALSHRDICDPATGDLLAQASEAGPEDLDRAVAAAKLAQLDWARTAPMARSIALRSAAERVRDVRNDLALIDARDSGNPLSGMDFDVTLGAALMDFFAGLATELKGETIPSGAGKLTVVKREPLGVVARIVPFNHPLMFACAKIAAPLIAGNAVILKPSEETPLAALYLAELIGDLFPPGLISVLTGGRALGEAITTHPGIAAVGLIGSVETGRAVQAAGAPSLKRTQLELGGKNALIICPDADVQAAIGGAIKGMNLGWTAGQSCGSTSRVLIHSSLYEEVAKGIAEGFDRVELGLPTSPDTKMGCLSTQSQYDKTLKAIATAKAEGGRLLTREDVPEDLTGFFVRPTVFGDVTPDMTLARSEVFGPVLALMRWQDEDEVIELANSLPVGLTASIWTRDLDWALRLSDAVEAGYVWVNNASDHYLGAPFGGVKQSGLGREECLEELYAYTEAKTITMHFNDHRPAGRTTGSTPERASK